MPHKDPIKRKEYMKQYGKEWYQQNKEKHCLAAKRRRNKHREEVKQFVNEYKASKGCCKCFENETICLDLHHVGNDKITDISSTIKNCWNKEEILNEIKKCVVICANCHRKLHSGLISLL